MSYTPAPHFPSLGEGFFDVVEPARFPKLVLRHRNQRAAASVGLDALDEAAFERHFARFEPLPDNLLQPLALRYHGHQFDQYNPRLGDGRGFLFAQLRDDRGRLLDLGTKGSGTTPWSRGGDGRLTLKGGVRELLATEMLEALGVYTSKTFALFETGESLERHDEPSPTRASVLTRLSHSHMRIGSFQRHHFERRPERVKALFDYSLEHFYPELVGAPDPVAAFLEEVTRRSARLCAAWLAAGFVHGVLNSDNMVVTGESFDYGPWRFLPHYDPGFTAAYFDHVGLYCYARQPRAVLNNLRRLASSLEGLAPQPARAAALDGFVSELERARTDKTLERLGVVPRGHDEDTGLVLALLDALAATELAFDAPFFDWWGGAASRERAVGSPRAEVYASAPFAPFVERLGAYEPVAAERLALPYFRRSGPASLVIDEVERVWASIAERDDWSDLAEKLTEIAELREAHQLVADTP